MPLPRSLADLKREISEKKGWTHDDGREAGPPGRSTKCRKATSRTARLAGSPKRLASRYHQPKTGHCRTGRLPALGQDPPYCPVLVVPVPLANERPPFRGVSGMEDAAEDPVGRGEGGDWEVEEPAEEPGPPGRWACSQAVLDFLSSAEVGKLVPIEEEMGAGSESSGWERRERRERRSWHR